MANETISPYMSLPVPVVGVDPGPQFALDVNSCMGIIDQHDHTPGHGVLITPGGMNINSDLTFNNNNLTSARAIRFQPQSAPIPPSGLDIGEIYESGVDLYYNDGAGNTIRITQAGGVAGSPGSITGLVPPASVSYNSINGTFIFQSAVNTPANLDAGFIILRNNVVNSRALTLQPPPAMAANYVLTLPPLPSQQSFMTLDQFGNITAPWTVDGTTIIVSSNQVEVAPGGIGPTQLASSVGTVPSGAVLPYFGTTAPTNFVLCDGTSYATASQPALFAAIGYSCGGSGANFNVPDLRGQFLRGVQGSRSSGGDPDSSSRTAMNTGGNAGNNVGSVQAFDTSASGLSISITDPGHHHTEGMGVQGGGGQFGTIAFSGAPAAASTNSSTNLPLTNAATTGITGAASGGGAETRPINAYCNYIIKT